VKNDGIEPCATNYRYFARDLMQNSVILELSNWTYSRSGMKEGGIGVFLPGYMCAVSKF